MLLLLVFVAANVALSFLGNRVLKVPGFDLAPFAIMVCAWRGESVLLASLLLTVSYAVMSLRELRFLWLSLPVTILTGYVAFATQNPLLLLALYHGVTLAVMALLGLFGARYLLFLGVNGALNLLALRLYGLFA